PPALDMRRRPRTVPRDRGETCSSKKLTDGKSPQHASAPKQSRPLPQQSPAAIRTSPPSNDTSPAHPAMPKQTPHDSPQPFLVPSPPLPNPSHPPQTPARHVAIHPSPPTVRPCTSFRAQRLPSAANSQVSPGRQRESDPHDDLLHSPSQLA